MMGRLKHEQEQLFYEFQLDEVVPDDHLVREIAAVLDLSWVRAKLASYYSPLGRPSIDPVLMIRMLIVGYVFAIRSERLLCREVQVNLAYRWFCGLSIEDKIPDHSAFSRARNERFRDSDIFRRVFEHVVEACVAAGLIGGEGFAVDASLIVADANKQRSIPGSEWQKTRDPETASRAVKEYLASLDDAAFGAASEVIPKFVSPSDPAAQWTGAMRGPAFFAYADNYLIDVKFGVIVDVEASRAIRQAEVGAAKTMIVRTEERFGLKPERLAADTAYGSAATLNWIVNEKKITPHIPVIDKSKREDGSLSRQDFTFDKDRNVYVCPQGKLLHTTGKVHDGETVLYRARTHDCGPCPLKPRCCPKAPERKIPRSIYEDARDAARALADTEAFEQSRHDRKRVEMLFAHLKRILKLSRLRLRGPRGAQDEFTLAAIAQNLRRLAKLVARPPPAAAACAA
jgi:transposase